MDYDINDVRLKSEGYSRGETFRHSVLDDEGTFIWNVSGPLDDKTQYRRQISLRAITAFNERDRIRKQVEELRKEAARKHIQFVEEEGMELGADVSRSFFQHGMKCACIKILHLLDGES